LKKADLVASREEQSLRRQDGAAVTLPVASPVALENYIAAFKASPLARWRHAAPWELTTQSIGIVRSLLASMPTADYVVSDEIAVHRSATVEPGAVLKGPLILGPGCFVAAGAYLRGGNWVDRDCTFGPGAELKSSFVFAGSKLAHFNFVGDSVLGAGVNLEAGSIVANYRNERADKEVLVRVGATFLRSGCNKFGALLGDGVRIGANAVVAPGALLVPGSVVRRGALCDQEDDAAAGPPGRS
jgi:UDP-N-acetylglucosamine diphosphorylase / glucose-1-phosphate thymidylyltransferase / UDP-N-acetylgalactosamine diphosphorylase / glucosamine-1-phosphate N-acetyltransferase / galactosamine-1-phosphate N-acetyltransferase